MSEVGDDPQTPGPAAIETGSAPEADPSAQTDDQVAAASTDAGAPARPPGCRERLPGYAHFDFWVGRWEVRDGKGQLLGHNHIAPLPRGCVLIEDWRALRGGAGTSLTYIQPSTGRWLQTWVDRAGGVLQLEGAFEDGSMVLVGPYHYADGREELWRGIWTPLDDGRVRQRFEVSPDGGDTFEPRFDGYYTRLPEPGVDRSSAVPILD